MRRIRLSDSAQQDISDLLARSEATFGPRARERYASLIVAALRDAASDNEELAVTLRPELGPGVRTWHLAHSRATSTGGLVKRPRHLLVYRLEGRRCSSPECFTTPWTFRCTSLAGSRTAPEQPSSEVSNGQTRW